MRPGDLLEQRYRLVRVLGRGRSGSVWCARNELIDRAVAVKILHRSLASDPERLQRFFQEARACGRVRHPSVVEVLDLGQGDDGVLFLVMELLEGETMASLLGRKGRLNVDEALALIIPLAHGLAAAHAHGILHRDLKPANIYLHKTPTGGLQPKILDFGISKIIGNDVTATGVVLGTPSYMSPEQARGVPDLDPRTDVWSLGVILYEALTGRLPFIAKEYRALVDEIIERKHVPVDQIVSDMPADVARVVDEVLEKSRDRRLPSAAAMAHRLTTILRSRGRGELLRDPEDEFSEGAPTLAHDRDKLLPTIDDTVGDHKPLAAQKGAKPEPAPPKPETTKPGVGLAKTQTGVSASAATIALAAQTSGSKRLEASAMPRPAAGAPARASSNTKSETTRATGQVSPDETRPDPMPLSRKPEPARGTNTQSWEVSAAQAASGRAEVILSSAIAPKASADAGDPAGRGPKVISVDDDWDTTVADVPAGDLTEKGPLPKLAPPPMLSEPPPKGHIKTGPQNTFAKPLAPEAAKKATLGSIPGFTAPTPPPPSVAPAAPPMTRATGASAPKSTPPPPRVLPATPTPMRAAPDDAPNKKGPPGPPPRSSTPPPGNAFSGATMRPPAEGFAQPRASVPPPADSPLLAPELYALGDQRIAEPVAANDGPPSDTNGHGPPVVLSSDPHSETSKRRRAGPSLVPLMVAAVAVLFFFGIVVGAVAASKRGEQHYAARFAAANGVLVTFHDHEVRLAHEEAKKAEADKIAEEKDPPPQPEPPAPASAEPPPAPAPTTTTAPKTVAAPKPVYTPKPTPKSTTTAKPTSTAKPTTTTTAKPATTSTTKKSGEKEWWQKKF